MGKKKHRKRRVRQVGALVYRSGAETGPEILLMSSRETGRAVIPKGWPMRGKSDAKAAAVEAWEEAGVRGRVGRRPVGTYRYWKRLDDHFRLLRVDVFPLRAAGADTDFPERGERRFAWLPQGEAALVVDDPELGALIRDADLGALAK
ncbi:NUDIX hydrolase [Oharaeibacter diazotrophicus]|uniref:Nudix hydrolase domain-containing protein n=1 Tax=Oharaeibacter diazotrophicus TaxID=1920512 RepID=A0A4V6PVF0_9HYPH|nr:NUDIX domain-containing protein [Oharaeibacter diazotrophicus]TDP83538.1 hypothetical protein EDD54_3500 [Oharaeibacter diazotrophicus]BBE72371.1 NUDIX domain protein [Pleomorphomonas sp. SM30]GLS79142.1 NUDIX hydrolase [Oharaeibacter diazotrophicus]